MLRTILFDLDGTLLPMDQEKFVKSYFGLLVKKMAPLGYDPKALIDGLWAGVGAMVQNDGTRRNEDVFWDRFCQVCGEKARGDMPVFEEYYRNEFQAAAADCGFTPKARQVVDRLKEKGYGLYLATNPIFPAVATESRMRWAGVEPGDFIGYTTYENSAHCKPNPDYYRDILAELDVPAEECLMVGNDVGEDMTARQAGMQVFLLTDCLINKNGADVNEFPHGDFDDLYTWITGEKL